MPRAALLAFFFALPFALGSRPAAAQERILLQEVLPALLGTDLGQIELGPAPPPGSARSVRRSEILEALREQGRDPRGLAIPPSTRVRREVHILDASTLRTQLHGPISEALRPCSVNEMTVPSRVSLPTGELSVEVAAESPPRSGRVTARVTLSAAGRSVPLLVSASVSCPPPIVSPGDALAIVARIGAVVATAHGVAREPGRVGDTIRVLNRTSQTAVLARIVDARTVEVIR